MRHFHTVVQPNGRLTDPFRQSMANIIHAYAGKWIIISIAERKEKRSNSQNAMLWGVINPHVRKVRYELGDAVSIDEVHEDLLKQFAPTVVKRTIGGETYTRPMRSKEMSVEQMNDYLTAITAYFANLGYPIPLERGEYEAICN